MAKARRTPPLFEVLGGTERRSTTSTPPGPVVSRPVQVRIPPQDGPVNGTASISPGERGAAMRPRAGSAWHQRPQAWFIAAAVLAVVFGVWYVAYHLGHDQAARDLVPKDLTSPTATPGTQTTPPPDTSVGTTGPALQPTGPGPTGPQMPAGGVSLGAADSGAPAGKDPEPTPQAPQIPSDPRKVGVNYLHLDTLPWRDAEQAVAYFTRNGVKVAAVPAKKVDPQQARDKNLPHLIFALEGVASEKYTSSAKFRSDLERKVREVGQNFQKKERGASDFASPYWVKYSGK